MEGALLVNVSGMNPNASMKLRRELREKSIHLQMVKNSLAKRAADGTPLASAFEELNKPTAVVWGGEDIVSLAKEVVRLAKIEAYAPFGPLGGVMEGERLTDDEVIGVAKWPSRKEQLSLLVGQRHAAVVTRAMAGHFAQALAILDDPTGAAGSAPGTPGTGRRFTSDEVATVLDGAGFDVEAMQAVRVFVDLVPSSLVDLEPGAAERLLALEQAVADRPEYLPLATQIHVVATRR